MTNLHPDFVFVPTAGTFGMGDNEIPVETATDLAFTESVADHRVEEFYAWNDFKSDFRGLKSAGNVLLDDLDDFAADLDAGLDLSFDLLDAIDAADSFLDLSRYEMQVQPWQ
jgi:hypothetical protein